MAALCGLAAAVGPRVLSLVSTASPRDKGLNRYLLLGFRRNLFEIKAELGESIEAEMWDRGWTKIYEVLPDAELTEAYQEMVGERLAEIIVCLHPIYVQLRSDVARIHR